MPKRKIIEINEDLCIGCGVCIESCAEGALRIVDGKAKVISDSFCDGLGACLTGCPTDALKIVEREADPFDEEAVKEHLEAARPPAAPSAIPSRVSTGVHAAAPGAAPLPCGCPGSMARALPGKPVSIQGGPAFRAASELRQWPVQLRLIPPRWELFDHANLLILADCAAVAAPDLHPSLVRGRTLALSCPKLDDRNQSLEKLTQIFRDNAVASVTVAIMEVPCCAGLHRLVGEALAASGKAIPVELIRLSVAGEILERRPA